MDAELENFIYRSNVIDDDNKCPTNNVTTWSLNTIIRVVIMPILLVLGILGNGFALGILFHMKSPYYSYYVLKCVSVLNLLTITFYWTKLYVDVRGVYTASPFFQHQTYLDFSTHYSLIFTNGFYTASIFAICLLLMDRYVAVNHPYRYNTFSSQPILRLAIYPITAVCLIMCFSSYFWYKLVTCYHPPSFPKNSTIVVNQTWVLSYYREHNILPQWVTSYDRFRETMLSIVPGILIFYFGILIAGALIQYAKRKQTMRGIVVRPITPAAMIEQLTTTAIDGIGRTTIDINNANLSKAQQRESKKNFIRNFSALLYFIFYCLCNLPNMIVIMFKQRIASSTTNSWLLSNIVEIANVMEAVFYTLNVYIYILLDKNFKKTYIKIYHRTIGKIYPTDAFTMETAHNVG